METLPERWIARLRQQLAADLPGEPVQLVMAPETRPNIRLDEARKLPCREAAVLVLMLPWAGVPSVLLTVRTAHLGHHPGQISFPGGRREPGESLTETALREAQEELGLAPQAVELVGTLTPLYIPPSNFCVYPQVGVCRAEPALTPHPGEVERILPLPVGALVDPATRIVEKWPYRGAMVQIPCYRSGTHTIWGATAMMLAELAAVLEQGALASPGSCSEAA